MLQLQLLNGLLFFPVFLLPTILRSFLNLYVYSIKGFLLCRHCLFNASFHLSNKSYSPSDADVIMNSRGTDTCRGKLTYCGHSDNRTRSLHASQDLCELSIVFLLLFLLPSFLRFFCPAHSFLVNCLSWRCTCSRSIESIETFGAVRHKDSGIATTRNVTAFSLLQFMGCI